MRVTQILLPALVALATAACARQQASYYVIDPATHQQAGDAAHAAPYAAACASRATQQAPAASEQPRPVLLAADCRSSLMRRPATASRLSAGGRSSRPSGRGLFNTYARSRTSYAPPAYPQQAYAPPPPQAPTPSRLMRNPAMRRSSRLCAASRPRRNTSNTSRNNTVPAGLMSPSADEQPVRAGALVLVGCLSIFFRRI